MKSNEIKAMTDADLAKKLQELKSELFNLRFRHASGQLENPLSIRSCTFGEVRRRNHGKKFEKRKSRSRRLR